MANEPRDALDRLLDEGLASYAAEEPRTGLEQRVLHRVRAEGARPRWLFLRWALPAAALACVVAGVMLRTQPAPAPERQVASQIPPPEVPAAVPAPEEPAAPPRQRPARPSLPKLAVFPTPMPLTPEERALTRVVVSAPEENTDAAGDSPQGIEPIEVDKIEIPPLQIGDGTQ